MTANPTPPAATNDDELIEKTARSICKTQGKDPDDEFSANDTSPKFKNWMAYKVHARAAIDIARPVIRREALEEAEKHLAKLREKHGKPAGSKYEEGAWDHGHRAEAAIRALIPRDEEEKS